MALSALLNGKFYFWKTNPKRTTPAVCQACTSSVQSCSSGFCPISIPPTLYCTVTVIVSWALLFGGNLLPPTHFVLYREYWKYDYLQGLANNCFCQPFPQLNILFLWKHVGEPACPRGHTHSGLPAGSAAHAHCSSGSRQLSLQLAILGPFHIFLCTWNTLPGVCMCAHTETDSDVSAHTPLPSPRT